MVGHDTGSKPVTVAPSVTKEEPEQTDGAAAEPVGVVVSGGGMSLNVLGDDATANVTVVREVDGQPMKVVTAAAATRGLLAADLSLMETAFEAGLIDVLVGSAVGYGPACVTIGASSFSPATERSPANGAVLLNFMAGPKQCLLKACPLVHSFFDL